MMKRKYMAIGIVAGLICFFCSVLSAGFLPKIAAQTDAAGTTEAAQEIEESALTKLAVVEEDGGAQPDASGTQLADDARQPETPAESVKDTKQPEANTEPTTDTKQPEANTEPATDTKQPEADKEPANDIQLASDTKQLETNKQGADGAAPDTEEETLGQKAAGNDAAGMAIADVGDKAEPEKDAQGIGNTDELQLASNAAAENENKLTEAEDDTEENETGHLQIALFSKQPKTELTCAYVIPNVVEYMNVREEPDTGAKLVGTLRVKNYAKILERGEEWTKIQSGNVIGYAKNEYLYFDKEALDLLEQWDAYQAVVRANSLNIRLLPEDGEILAVAGAGDTFTYLPQYSVEDWVAISYGSGTVAYLFEEYVELRVELDTARTVAEIEAERRAKELARALEEAKKYKPASTNRAPIELTDEEIYLLATVIAMEALGESYEGKLAVANVVINRMLDGYWGRTIKEVVYAPGQFSGANSGRVEEFWSQVTEECKRAAIEALAGVNNIGDYLFFISLRKANFSAYDQYYILGGHCFYNK